MSGERKGRGAADRLRAGETLELSVEKPVYRGRGLARHEGQVVFVPRAHPGESVRARVREVHAGWAEAALERVIRPAPFRRESPCPFSATCGGCAYQEVGYAEQLRIKESVLRDSLQRAGVAYAGAIPIHASPERGWRMRARLHFAASARGARLQLGLRQEGSRRLVDVTACLQLSARMNDVALAWRDRLAGRPALAPALQGLDLLESPDGSALVAAVETTLERHQAGVLAPVGESVPGLAGFGAWCREHLVWLRGVPHVEAVVLGLRYRTHVGSFFQGNRFLLERLVRGVRDLVPPETTPVLDLYSGAGLFSLPLASRDGCRVTSVEIAARAAEDAVENARAAGLSLVRVVPEDAGKALRSLSREVPERVVLDPPRTGAGTEVVDLVAARAPSLVVYVSCDPPTLARDLRRFAAHGYRPDAVEGFDLFPDTFHLETVVRLRPAAPM